MPQLLGSTKSGMAVLYKGRLSYLRKIAKALRRWAIYRDYVQGRPFHNATDERYLIDHDDLYWHNRENRQENTR